MTNAATKAPNPEETKLENARANLEQSLQHLDIVPASMAPEAWVEFTKLTCLYINDLYALAKKLRHPLNTTLGRSDFVKADKNIRRDRHRVLTKMVGAFGTAAIGATIPGICQPLADGKTLSGPYIIFWVVVAIIGSALAAYQYIRE